MELLLSDKTAAKFLRSLKVFGVIQSVTHHAGYVYAHFVDRRSIKLGELVPVDGEGFPQVRYASSRKVVLLGCALKRAKRWYDHQYTR
jgi:hypothetical protein